jgi:UDP-GlcNAc:undecaprenyl-phosphate/decaprenyl-phosphate GlcNAc-1-phosphate transferase
VSWLTLAFSALVALAVVPAGREALIAAGLRRPNYRGRELPFPLGAAIVASALVALAVLAPLDALADEGLLHPELGRWITFVIGVAFLGLLDDVLGRGGAADAARGWRGHSRAVLSGRLSTGAIKALGALALAAFVLARRGEEGWQYVADIVLLLLATNLMNLFDTGPGRAEKAFALLALGLSLGAWTAEPAELLAPFLGPVAVGAAYTLRERAMLGDTGSNVLGALAGIWLLTSLGDDARLVALAILLAITAYGEFRSIGSLIERLPPLRLLDSAGRVR